MESADTANDIVAAGGLVIDAGRAGAPLVLLVHRPKYDDWSFPKGKAEPNETIEQMAIREVGEETGLTCRIIRHLHDVRYSHEDRKGETKYEIDRAEWFEVDAAKRLLSYERDRELLDRLVASDFK
jgi:8-oxo-dGTP pyrophosphatase MutT (NUDIX family)